MPDPLIIPVEVDTSKGKSTLEDFRGDVEELKDRYSPVEVPIAVDAGDAVSDLDKVADAADEVDRLDPELEVGADVSKATKGLDDVKGKASDASGTVGTLRDLGGPLDEAFSGLSGTAGDFGEAFSIAGEQIGGAFGMGEEALGRLSTAMGIGGAAVGAVLIFWQMFKQGAEDAKKEVEAIMKTQEQLAAGETARAAEEIVKKLGVSTIGAAHNLGLSTKQVVDFVTGATDKLGPLTDRVAALREEFDKEAAASRSQGTPSSRENELASQLRVLEDVTKGVGSYRDKWIDANGTLQETATAEFEVASALGASTDQLLEQAKTIDGPTRDAILRHVAQLEGIPPQVITDILALPDDQQLAAVKGELDKLKDPINVPVRLMVDWSKSSYKPGDIQGAGINVPVKPTATVAAVDTYEARNGPR